ncbi:MAG: hypothetical protein ABSC42_14765 [Tepidisphaeraceae bacterium]|jgi:hypothetical protein
MNRTLNKSLLISSVAAVLGMGGLSGCVIREEAPPPTVTVSPAPPPPAAPAPAPGDVVVQEAPPPDVYEAPPPSPDPTFVWVGGFWWWDGGRYVWRHGYWGRHPYGRGVWVRDGWVRGPHGYVYVRGHWR